MTCGRSRGKSKAYFHTVAGSCRERIERGPELADRASLEQRELPHVFAALAAIVEPDIERLLLRVDAKPLAAHEGARRRAGGAIAPRTRQLQGPNTPAFGPKVHSSAPDRKHCAVSNPARNAAATSIREAFTRSRGTRFVPDLSCADRALLRERALTDTTTTPATRCAPDRPRGTEICYC